MPTNYTLIEKKKIEELNAIGMLYQHDKSGAKVFVISNDDQNKAFSISFRTPPNDHTGLPHILEHSVLCGSRKFPIKDPFVELAKGSLNTFLNAMTFSDKTMYPVASCNDKDFENLMDVYMDAVLYPNIYREDKILKQEGWHYELNDIKDEITYKGVVYNEMKGVFSSPEQILFRKIQQSLFPDNAYSHESGGDPDFITDLTWEDFNAFHKKYYHPSNSYIFLYGNVDMEQKLQWLDDKYLRDFDSIAIESSIPLQTSFEKQKELVDCYPISSNESTSENTYLSLNFVTGDSRDKVEYVGLEVLEYLLLEAPGAPLKKALLDAEIGKDVFGSFDNSILQPTFSVVIKNSEESLKEKFLDTINTTLVKLCEEGIEKKKIKAAINYFEFKTREADFGRYPKGVIYSMKAMDSWLYDASPFIHFEYNEIFEKLKSGMDENYFEQLIKKYLINNHHSSVLILKPDAQILTEKEAQIKEKLKAYKESLSEIELSKLVSETKALEEYQNEVESKEDTESIPILDVEDIKKDIERMDIEEKIVNNVKILRHETFTNNIVYLQLSFNTKKVPFSEIPYLGLLTSVLGKMDTTNFGYSDLSSEINIHTGGIKYNTNVYGVNDEQLLFNPRLEIVGKCFTENVPKLFELIQETLFETAFSDKIRLREIICEIKSRLKMTLSNNGHLTAATRAESYYSNVAYYLENIGGISYYQFIEKCENNFEEMADNIIKSLTQVMGLLLKPENLVVGLTSELSALNVVQDQVDLFTSKLDGSILDLKDIEFSLEKRNEGFMNSGKVQYVAKAGNFLGAEYKYSGTLRVLQTILSLDYLWQNVRVKGGAYGCMASFKRNGSVYFVSYRDPNLTQTIETYDKMVDYISTYHADEREMRKYIIGTISKLDQPLTPSMKNDRILALYFGHISNKELQNERDEVLTATAENVRGVASVIKDTLKQGYICVIGNESKVKEASDIFGEVKHLF